jgi:hypothetical protein
MVHNELHQLVQQYTLAVRVVLQLKVVEVQGLHLLVMVEMVLAQLVAQEEVRYLLALVVLPEIKLTLVAMEHQMLKVVAVVVVHTIIEAEMVVLLVVRVVPGVTRALGVPVGRLARVLAVRPVSQARVLMAVTVALVVPASIR